MAQKFRLHCHACGKTCLVRVALADSARCPHCGEELPVVGEEDLDAAERKSKGKRRRRQLREPGARHLELQCWACGHRWKVPYRGSAFGHWMDYLFLGGGGAERCPECNLLNAAKPLAPAVLSVLQLPVMAVLLLVFGQSLRDLLSAWGNVVLWGALGIVLVLCLGTAAYGAYEFKKRL